MKAGGMSIGAIVIVGILTWIMGGNPLEVLTGSSGMMGGQEATASYTPSAQEEEMATFSRQILAATEDVWTEEFRKMGKTYVRLLLFSSRDPCRADAVMHRHLRARSIARPTRNFTSTFRSLSRCDSQWVREATLPMPM